MSYPVAPFPVSEPVHTPIPAGRVALVGSVAVMAAVVANVVVYFTGGVLVTYHSEFLALANVAPTVFFTLVSGISAALVYALVLRLSRRPTRTFIIVAVVVFVLTLIPDLVAVPTMPGATSGQTAVLLTMHIVAALVLVGVLTTRTRPK